MPKIKRNDNNAPVAPFPPKPIVIQFTMGEITHFFPVLKEKSIGLEYRDRWMLIQISKDEITFENLPGKEILTSPQAGCEVEILEIMDPTFSPSGKWAYFNGDGEGKQPDTHYIVYLDPKLPNSSLPPFRLSVEGKVQCAGWMTAPEGLVLYKDGKLWYFDVSDFESGESGEKK
jgi:hypothetical protein